MGQNGTKEWDWCAENLHKMDQTKQFNIGRAERKSRERCGRGTMREYKEGLKDDNIDQIRVNK